jgi:hypothetical protein
MNNLVDLSSIHGFSFFNNIKQIGGGKIFYYIDEKGNRTRVDPNLSKAINDYLKKDEFLEMSFIHFQIDDLNVYLYKKPTGEIFGELDISGQASTQKKFIAIDQSSDAAEDDWSIAIPHSAREIELKSDSHDTRFRATSSSAPRDESAAALPLIPAQLSDPRRVIWRKNLEEMSVTLIVIPPFSAIKEDYAKKFAEEFKSIFNEKGMIVNTSLLSEKKPTFEITRDQLSLGVKKEREDEINKQEDGTTYNLFSYFHIDRFIAVVCKINNDITNNVHILYFVDISNGTLREILRVDYEITDVVFNPIYSENNIKFAVIGIKNEFHCWSLLNFSDSIVTIIESDEDLYTCAIAYSQDGQSIIFCNYNPDDVTDVDIYRLRNTGSLINPPVYQNTIDSDMCDKIKLSPSGDLIVMKGSFGIYVYNKRLRLHSKYLVDRDDPNFDNSNRTINYGNRTCELFIVDNFYTTIRQDSLILYIALYTKDNTSNISCIHLCDVNAKKKIKQFVFPNISISHMELYLDKIHLILSTNKGMYALNTITRKINKIMDRLSKPFGMIKNLMFCSDKIVKIDGSVTNSLENIDLHQIENLLVLNDPSAQLLLSLIVSEGTLLLPSPSETPSESESSSPSSSETPSESESSSPSASRSPSPSPAAVVAAEVARRKAREESRLLYESASRSLLETLSLPSIDSDTDTRASQGREKIPKNEYTIELNNEEYIAGLIGQPNIIVSLTLYDIERMILNKQQDLEQNRSSYSDSKQHRIESNIQILQMKLEELTKQGGYNPHVWFHHCY